MDARKYWNGYVKRVGGIHAVSAHLGIPYSTIACICNGSRGIGHRLAARMAVADPNLDERQLIWVRPIERPVLPRTPMNTNQSEVA